MQKWADKEGSSALAVWKGFVFVLVFEFSVATRHIHDNLEKITFSTNIWTFPELMTNTEIIYILQNLQLDCRIYPSIVPIVMNSFHAESEVSNRITAAEETPLNFHVRLFFSTERLNN